MDEKISVRRYKYIKKEARKVLESSFDKNPLSIANKLGLRVILYNLKDGLCGFIQGRDIYINSNIDDYSKQIVISHEIGHYILHKNSDGFELFGTEDDTIKELEANLFAREIFPQAFVKIGNLKRSSAKALNEYTKKQIRNKLCDK